MKFALFVLLGLCAVAAHASFETIDFDIEELEPRNKITDQIRAKIEELIKKATDEFGVIAEKIVAITNKLREEARDLLSKGMKKIDEAKDQLRKKIDELKKKGGKYTECAKTLEPEYKKVEKETISGLKQCAGEVKAAKEEHREASDKAVQAIRTNLNEIRKLVGDCLGWNPVSATKCIFEKTSELKKLVDGVISGGHDAFKASRQRAHDILTKARECNGKVFSNASAKVKDLNQKLAQCVQSSEFEFY